MQVSMKHPETMREKCVVIYEILNELNPNVFETPDDVFYTISRYIGQLQEMDPPRNGENMFMSSGMLRVQETCNIGEYDILIDPYITFP